MAHVIIQDEQYIFRRETRNKLFIMLGIGVLLFVIGLLVSLSGPPHADGHAMVEQQSELVASAAQHATAQDQDEHGAGHHEGPSYWVKRLFTTLWMNNVFFIGLGIIGLFFVAIHYAAQAGWSAGLIRVPLAMGTWIPIAGVLTIVLFFITNHTVFHWTHDYLYEEGGAQYDPIIAGKAPFFYWPGEGGGFPIFYILRMVLFFGMWYWFYLLIRKNLLAEDLEDRPVYWYKNRSTSAWFLVFFAVSSSVAAWDWVMSIDTHWFSTMFGWYVFASWWVTGLAMITLICAYLKEAGYLKVVNSNHLHDLGKYMFAFTIFWTYIWFSQFLLIWYANIPEESVYFIERMTTSPYSWIFYTNLIMNFVLPFLLLMTRDAKRQIAMLKVVCPIIIVGHWFDFFNMVTPGIMQNEGALGFLEIGVALIFFAVYLLVVLGSLAKYPLVGKNHPTLVESLNHHI
ncbi:MAG TPA: quinol:cytochrome C oxidoreductase [Chryseosolibacter sp.]|nr:quinol:cytochrome C oxidoreductase [Chryseosolibacter sp.]